MRRPSSYRELFGLWEEAVTRGSLYGGKPYCGPIHDGEPRCGFFRTQLVREGPWVPARVWCEREIDPETGDLASDEVLCCTVGDQRRDPVKAWRSIAAHPISRAEYDRLIDLRRTIPEMAATLVKYDASAQPMRPPR